MSNKQFDVYQKAFIAESFRAVIDPTQGSWNIDMELAFDGEFWIDFMYARFVRAHEDLSFDVLVTGNPRIVFGVNHDKLHEEELFIECLVNVRNLKCFDEFVVFFVEGKLDEWHKKISVDYNFDFTIKQVAEEYVEFLNSIVERP